MKTENLVDALELLPEELLEEADRLRRKKPFPWKGITALAACLCLVAGLWFMIPGQKSLDAAPENAGGIDRDEHFSKDESFHEEHQGYWVQVTSGNGRITLSLPVEWGYEIREQGIRFWAPGQESCVVKIQYYDGGFGVCGTSLVTEEYTTRSGRTGTMDYMDDSEVWTYIVFDKCYAVTHSCSKQWLEEFQWELSEILNSMEFN